MLGKKKQSKGRRSNESHQQLMNLGLVPDEDNSDDEAALEAELQKLMYGGSKATKPKKRKSEPPAPDLDKMVAACMVDVSDDNEDGASEDDADLLNELAEFEDDGDDNEEEFEEEKPFAPPPNAKPKPHFVAPIAPPASELSGVPNQCAGESLLTVIETRLEMYAVAEKKSKEIGETSRARRFARGLATLRDLHRKIKTGKAIDENDIPPALASFPVTTPKEELAQAEVEATPPRPAPVTSSPATETPSPAMATPSPATVISRPEQGNPILGEIAKKRERYKEFALTSKKEGDKSGAVWGLTAVKQCDELIQRVRNGEKIELSALPTLPSEPQRTPTSEPSRPPQPQPPTLERSFSRDAPIQIPDNPDDIPEANPVVVAKTADEALRQRLEKYKQDEAKAKSEGNSSRARRIGRICKQYEEAIVLHKKGKLALVLADLPCPHGFGPISLAESSQANAPTPGLAKPPLPETKASLSAGPPTVVRKPQTLQEKQLLELEKRQNQFKSAALVAKKAGQIEEAKDYLRKAKGFDSLIEAAKSGLPVDFKSLPVAPQAIRDVAMDFEIVSTVECTPSDLNDTSRQEMYKKLETDLVSQIKMCQANRIYFKSTGDVPSANKFHQMEEHTKKDLDSLRFAFRRGDPVPKFHYEVRSYSKVVVCSDLTDSELEFTCVQAINLNVAKDAHTYCKLEFPYPKDAPFRDKSAVVKDTNSPEFNHSVKVPLNLKDKACLRLFKPPGRQAAKVEVWNKVGFMRSDVCVGSVQVKLTPLESKCELHDTYPLMEGRKAVGGQLEIKMRVRNPTATKQIEKVEEKWLVIVFG